MACCYKCECQVDISQLIHCSCYNRSLYLNFNKKVRYVGDKNIDYAGICLTMCMNQMHLQTTWVYQYHGLYFPRVFNGSFPFQMLKACLILSAMKWASWRATSLNELAPLLQHRMIKLPIFHNPSMGATNSNKMAQTQYFKPSTKQFIDELTSPIWQLKQMGEHIPQQHLPKLSHASPQAQHPHQLSMHTAIWQEGQEQKMHVAILLTVDIMMRKILIKLTMLILRFKQLNYILSSTYLLVQM